MRILMLRRSLSTCFRILKQAIPLKEAKPLIQQVMIIIQLLILHRSVVIFAEYWECVLPNLKSKDRKEKKETILRCDNFFFQRIMQPLNSYLGILLRKIPVFYNSNMMHDMPGTNKTDTDYIHMIIICKPGCF